MNSPWLRWVVAGVAGLAWGCATGGEHRTVTIRTRPADAQLRVDDRNRGPAPFTHRFSFKGGTSHTIVATRFGFLDQTYTLTADNPQDEVLIVLPPWRRPVTFVVGPVPGVVSVDGKPLSPEPTRQITTQLEFTLDAQDHWVAHTASAERFGFRKADVPVRWDDANAQYALTLEPVRKDVRIVTDPPGAEVFINGESVGLGPVTYKNFAVPSDPDAKRWTGLPLKAVKPGYEPAEGTIGWDGGKSEYALALGVRSKAVRVVTDPPGAAVTVDGKELPRDAAGASSATLAFPPVDDKGQLKTYAAVAAPPAALAAERQATPLNIGWDDGQAEYRVALQLGRLRKVPLVRAAFARDGGGGAWQVKAERVMTTGPADVAEPDGRRPVLVARAGPGESIDTLTCSPDGARLVFAVTSAGSGGELRSLLRVVRADGAEPPTPIETGATINLTPAFSPDGNRLLFTADRAGTKAPAIWSLPLPGAPGAGAAGGAEPAEPVRLTPGGGVDLWPSLDALPKPRLFYASLSDGPGQGRLLVAPADPGANAAPTDLGAGREPRISPAADRVAFTQADPKSGKRDVYLTSDAGGNPTNLTRSPTTDDFDPVWSRDGGRLAFVSDRPLPGRAPPAAAAGASASADYNIWVMDVADPKSAVPVTTSESWDDCPAWDPAGKSLYFRSNRGGEWGIWKIDVGR